MTITRRVYVLTTPLAVWSTLLVLCRLEVRVFRGVEKVSMVIPGIGRANSLDRHHCWESAWN